MKKKEMTIKEMLSYVTWGEVKRSLEYHYPEYNNKYARLFKDLSNRTYIKPKRKDERIELKAVNFFVDEVEEDRFYDMHTNQYSMSFRDWNELLYIPVSHTTLQHHTLQDIVAHFLWEITWYGNEKQTQKRKKDLFAKSEEIRKQLSKLDQPTHEKH